MREPPMVLIAPAEPELSLGAVARPFRRRWRLVAATIVASWLVGLAVLFIPARRYTASVVLAALPNTRLSPTGSLAGGLTALLGSVQFGGVQSTPYFVTKLLQLRGVILRVANEPVAAGGERVIERVMEKPLARIEPTRVERAMRRVIAADVDKQTGLVTLRVRHTDSAVVRHIATSLVTAASQTFIDVVRAQATSQREAQAARLDSARRQLRGAEQKLAGFLAANRAYAEYSSASILRERVQRELTNAQTVYQQATTDLESAIARELESTPAVVVVDPISQTLLPDARQVPLVFVIATALGFIASALLLLARGEFAKEMSAAAREVVVRGGDADVRERVGSG